MMVLDMVSLKHFVSFMCLMYYIEVNASTSGSSMRVRVGDVTSGYYTCCSAAAAAAAGGPIHEMNAHMRS